MSRERPPGGPEDTDPLILPAGLRAIPVSRSWVVQCARRTGCPESSLRTLALLTTEAVTNAVHHGEPGGEVTVAIAAVDGGWRVAVSDRSPALPVLRHVGPFEPGGRGVMLIDRLASAWGVEPHDGSVKVVWFEVA